MRAMDGRMKGEGGEERERKKIEYVKWWKMPG